MLWEREVEFKATLEQVARKPSKRLMAHAAQIAVEDHKVVRRASGGWLEAKHCDRWGAGLLFTTH
jgi:hypothetical protein